MKAEEMRNTTDGTGETPAWSGLDVVLFELDGDDEHEVWRGQGGQLVEDNGGADEAVEEVEALQALADGASEADVGGGASQRFRLRRDFERRAREIQIERYGTIPACCERGECGRCRVEIDRIVAELRAEAVVGCECGEATREPCGWKGPRADIVTLEWMPPHLRASHVEGRNGGAYPHNGARRLQVASACAQYLIDAAPEWASIVR